MFNDNYLFRSNGLLYVPTRKSKSKYGDNTFNFIFSKLINKISISTFRLEINEFKNEIKANFKENMENFYNLFNKFKYNLNINYDYIH